MNGIELWGGIECTLNRVGEAYHDQVQRCGHYERLEDIDAIGALGIRRLRYPVLWERIAPDGIAQADWSWSDAVLTRMRELAMEPIAGLVHHGSGPRDTSLLDPAFPSRLAAYARAVAQRYPWIRMYTPVNEPLTTARFAALYGHWYPHARDDASFVAALLVQCRAIVESMAAIREVTPDALLVQTEDAAMTRSTPALADQAAFENVRRWLSLDLLTGRVTTDHPLWDYLVGCGASIADLEWFAEHACPPDIVGLNYYVTSDRFLDDRFDRHARSTHGGNGRVRYADVESARIPGIGVRGHAHVLEEAWDRYRLPVAITEAHLGCTREDQLRWLCDAWTGARDARTRGADVRAVTAWALLGSWDWNSLVTRTSGHYEPGVFDVRGGRPRPTALAAAVRELTAGRTPQHPLLEAPGWWKRVAPDSSAAISLSANAPLAIVGATGTLGRAFAQACEARGIACVLLRRQDMDITDPTLVRAAIARIRPWAVVNAAGYVRVDDAERDRSACRRVNAVGPSLLAAACRKNGIRFLTFSSDLVFDGAGRRPYIESDRIGPLNVYGRTKAEAERRVLALHPAALVVRTSAFFSPWDPYNFVTIALGVLEQGRPFRAPADAVVSPTYVPDLVATCLDLLIDGASGVWHLANDGAVTWAELARRAAKAARLDETAVQPCRACDLLLSAVRPAYSVLGTERGRLLPALEDSLERYVRDRQVLGTAA